MKSQWYYSSIIRTHTHRYYIVRDCCEMCKRSLKTSRLHFSENKRPNRVERQRANHPWIELAFCERDVYRARLVNLLLALLLPNAFRAIHVLPTAWPKFSLTTLYTLLLFPAWIVLGYTVAFEKLMEIALAIQWLFSIVLYARQWWSIYNCWYWLNWLW